MRLKKMEELVTQLADTAPAASHVLSAENVFLPIGSRVAHVAVGNIPITEGLYQFMLYTEFDAPDQGDGTPPQINMHLGGPVVDLQGKVDPWGIFQGNIGPSKYMDSDRGYVEADGTLAISLWVESSAVADTDSSQPVTIDKFRLALLG